MRQAQKANKQTFLSAQAERKIVVWKNKLKQLEEVVLPKAMQRIGESGIGDWHENAEFEDAERQVEVVQTRIAEIKQIIKSLEKGESK